MISFLSFVDELVKIANDATDRLQEKLQPGDILTTQGIPKNKLLGSRQQTFVQRVVSPISERVVGPYSHAGIYVGDGKLVEVMPHTGVREIPLDKYEGFLTVNAVRPKVSPGERRRAAEWARQQVGKPYAYSSLPRAILSDRIDLKERPRNDKFICSTLVSSAYPSIKFSDRKPTDAMLPRDLALSDKNRPVAKIHPGVEG